MKRKAISDVYGRLHSSNPYLKVHKRHKKSGIFILTFLESDNITMAKYEVDANDETYMTDQMKQNLTIYLVKIYAYGVGSQTGRGRK